MPLSFFTAAGSKWIWPFSFFPFHSLHVLPFQLSGRVLVDVIDGPKVFLQNTRNSKLWRKKTIFFWRECFSRGGEISSRATLTPWLEKEVWPAFTWSIYKRDKKVIKEHLDIYSTHLWEALSVPWRTGAASLPTLARKSKNFFVAINRLQKTI